MFWFFAFFAPKDFLNYLAFYVPGEDYSRKRVVRITFDIYVF